MPRNKASYRKALSLDTIEMLFSAGRVFGRPIRGRGARNGRSCKGGWNGRLFSSTRRSRLARLGKIGRRTAVNQARQERNPRSRKVLETCQSGSRPDRDESAAARIPNGGDRGRASQT